MPHRDTAGTPVFCHLASLGKLAARARLPARTSHIRRGFRSLGPSVGPNENRTSLPGAAGHCLSGSPSTTGRGSSWALHTACLCCDAQSYSGALDAIYFPCGSRSPRKGPIACHANWHLGRTGEPFWQQEYFDRTVREEKEFFRIRRYIEWNPVNAGLAAHPEEFPWSSAGQAEVGLKPRAG